ncbi:hypothetical protein M426DRAFT_142386 [Hypoxylon sp. CI-4A]|nr:hypothetical protein M426DRAFT_142386 [Hypoxylon sp. CI-4A]
MAEAKVGHLERTAAEPRDKSLHTVTLAEVTQINDQIRLFCLELSAPLRFLPGQWLDVYVPGVSKAGGYTITSPPSKARPATATTETEETSDSSSSSSPGYLELAVQKSEDPPAAWLWQDPDAITYAELRVRVGGSFVWPPPGVNARALRRVVFVAGGVGVNPLVSVVASLAEKSGAMSASASASSSFEVRFLYSLKDEREDEDGKADRLLFVERIARIFTAGKLRGGLQLFLTGGGGGDGDGDGKGSEGVLSYGGDKEGVDGGDVPFLRRRMTVDDVAAAVGDASERRFAAVYVCGVPTMTDEFVQKLTDPQHGLGMESHRVLCEKWW